jgi:hypothetical protein
MAYLYVIIGKFTPIPGFMHFSAPETLSDQNLSPEDVKPRDSRYDELASMFGWTFVDRLGIINIVPYYLYRKYYNCYSHKVI